VIEMLKALTSLFAHHEPSPAQSYRQEWDRCLAGATSQNEIDEINDLFSGAVAA
jgi:hypothetical protein